MCSDNRGADKHKTVPPRENVHIVYHAEIPGAQNPIFLPAASPEDDLADNEDKRCSTKNERMGRHLDKAQS